MSSRIIMAKALLLTVVLALSIHSAWSQTVQVSPGTSNITAGGTPFDVTVQIDGVTNLQASHVEFTFDNTLVQYAGVTKGDVLSDGDDVFQTAPAPGAAVNNVTVDQAAIGTTPADGNGTLFTISFVPLKGGTSAIDLTVTLRDPSNNTIAATVTDGEVNVANPAPTLTSIDPLAKTVGDAEFTLTVNGTNLLSGVSTVYLDGNPRTTQFVNATQLTATIPASDLLSAGDKNVTVVNAAPGGGTSSGQTLTVNQAPTTTSVSGSPNPSYLGQSVEFTAIVTPSAATGTVEFFDGALSLGTGTLTSGTATLSTSALAVGVHSNIKAFYSGDANYNGSENSTAQTVNPVITATAGPGGSISPSGAVVVPYGTNQSFTITPATGYHTVDVLADGASQGALAEYTFNDVTANHTVSATFAINTYTLELTIAGSGEVVTDPPTGPYNHGAVVRLTASANSGYTFTGWSGSATGETNPLDVTMDGNKAITATFSANAYSVTVSGTNGTVTKDPDKTNYAFGESVTLTAVPAIGYHFVNWSGSASGSENPLTITVDGDKTVTANFEANAYTLTLNPAVGGALSKSPDQTTYAHGAVVQVTAVPATGYAFAGWSGDATGSTNPVQVTMDGDKFVTATFTIHTHIITVTAGPGGSITPPGPTTVDHGGSQLYTITPDPGYHIVDVKVNSVSQGAIPSYEFTNVIADGSIEATFAINSYTLTVSAGVNGTIVPAGPTVSVNHGDNQAFTMTPAAGYHVASLTVDGTRVNPAATHTFPAVDSDHAISVTFAVDEYDINGLTEYDLDVDGNSATDMKVNLAAKPLGDATISAIAYVTPPAGAPALPPDALPLYLDVNSTLPAHAFASTVRLDLSGITGFGPGSVLAYYNEVTSNWVLIDGVYLASDPLFGGHPSFTFQTDHFCAFAFFNPPATPLHVYGSTSPSVAAQVTVYPNNTWRPVGPTYGGVDDWSWSGLQVVSIYLVPQVGAHFGSADITLEWDPTQLAFGTVDFGSAPSGLYGSSAGYSPSTTVTEPYGPGRLRIQCTRGDNGNFTTVAGQYLARVDFSLLKPGHTPVAIIGAGFTILPAATPAYFFPMQAEVKTYLADVTAVENTESGDGKVDFEDLVDWSYSYWVGVPGYTGGASYKVKYDFGPTADNYIFTLPQPDGKIDFEDLLIFSLGYGQTAAKYLPKAAAQSSEPVEISLGAPVANGNEVAIPVMLGGSVGDVRGLRLELNGQFGAFLGVEKGGLLQNYASPVPLLHRSEGRSVYLDLAVMGLTAPGLDRPGEVVKLRFAGNPRVQLTGFEARDSRNMQVQMKKVKGAGEAEPTVFALLQNYPNPFNPTTTIEYQLPAPAMTNIEVYNMLGERVATLVNEMQPAGFYTAQWNGTNDAGAKVATGVYLYRMRTEGFSMVKKMLLVK